MTIILVCLVTILALVSLSQYFKIQRLRKRCKFLNRSRKEWVQKFLESDQKLGLTRAICNISFEAVLRYKAELAAINDRILLSESEKGAVS